jgi:hypothetical protein
MKTEQVQLTLFLPDHEDQPALALPAPAPHAAAPAPNALSVRDAAHLYGRRIKDMPMAEQPASRLQHYGAGALSTSELLAILLGAQTMADADHVLGEAEGLAGLARMTFSELVALPAVGEATAARIKAAFDLGVDRLGIEFQLPLRFLAVSYTHLTLPTTPYV